MASGPAIPSFADEQDRPLSDVQRASNLLGSTFSTAASAGAENLLTKALLRLETGDRQAAEPFVERTLRLPYDEHEKMEPGIWSAHMFLYISISDDLEASETGDSSWLDRAQTLIDVSPPVAAAEVRSCLRSLLDGTNNLSASETRRVKAMTRGLSFDADPLIGVPNEPGPRKAGVMEVLDAIIHHRRQLDQAGVEGLAGKDARTV
jgi:hypothetical protein